MTQPKFIGLGFVIDEGKGLLSMSWSAPEFSEKRPSERTRIRNRGHGPVCRMRPKGDLYLKRPQ